MSTAAAAAHPAATAPPFDVEVEDRSSRRAEIALWVVVGLAVLATTAAIYRGFNPALVLGVFVFGLVIVSYQSVLLSWQTLLGAILFVILFIPIRRYTVAAGAPIELEPYRILIAIVLGCWFLALCADPNVRLRASGYAGPILLLWLGILASLALNLGRVNSLSDFVLKQVTFFASYFLVMSFIVSVVRRGPQLDRMIKLLVGGGAIVAVCALYEWKSGTNLFNGLGRFLPFLIYNDMGDAMIRGSGARALASAQHPIALGAALVMLLPLSGYLFHRTRKKYWLVAGGLLTLGALSTGSRTAAIMLVVVFGTFAWIKRDEMLKLLPLWLVLLVVIQGVMPGTLASFKFMLNPSYMLKEQSVGGGTGSGRVADLGPSLSEWAGGNPFVGQGFGTRVTDQTAPDGGAQILDDQWLGTLLEIGAVGFFALMWLFCRAIKRMARRARTLEGSDSWLAAALCASLLAWTIGLFTYDAFAFIQVTFFSFVMLAFAAIVWRDGEKAGHSGGAA